jgi:hypothetical protein
VKLLARLFAYSALTPLSLSACALTAQTPLHGIVTDTGTPERFIVEHTPVLCSATKTLTFTHEADGRISAKRCLPRVLGESVTVMGKTKKGEVIAESIEPDIYNSHVEGEAVIERVSSPDAAGVVTIQADGYQIRLIKTAKQKWLEPLPDGAPVSVNMWVQYVGTQQPDGTITAGSLIYSPNELNARDLKISKKDEFDASAVTEKDRQGAISQFVLGVNLKRIPAYNDVAMQQRVNEIGRRLIPAYQRDLPANDPTKLNFRFQVVDKDKWKDGITLTNGIVLIPRQVIERLENDSQIATVLADNIACAAEKQVLRIIPTEQVITGTEIAGVVAGALVPGVGLVTTIGTSVAASKVYRHAEEQSGRVSLTLLHDAGYDITQAPVTWWILSSKKSHDKTGIPYRASYLYGQLATTWRSPSPVSMQGTGKY